MSTIRVSKDRNFSVINNTVLNDKRLTWKAKGLAAYLLSKPDDWKIIRENLINQSDDGETAVRTALQELEQCGYLVRTRRQNEAGRFEWESVLHETPLHTNPKGEPDPSDEKPLVENPPVVNPLVENQVLLNTDVPSTEVVNTKNSVAAQRVEASPPPPFKAILKAFVDWKEVNQPGCVINYAEATKAAKAVAQQNWTPDQVIQCCNILNTDPFYGSSSLSLWTVGKQIGAKVRRSTIPSPAAAAAQDAFVLDFDAIFGDNRHANTH